MEEQEGVYCKNCVRFYATNANQCEIPSCGIEQIRDDNTRHEYEDFLNASGLKDEATSVAKYDPEGMRFIRSHMNYIYHAKDNKIFGKPSLLNKNNDCYFYEPRKKVSDRIGLSRKENFVKDAAKKRQERDWRNRVLFSTVVTSILVGMSFGILIVVAVLLFW